MRPTKGVPAPAIDASQELRPRATPLTQRAVTFHFRKSSPQRLRLRPALRDAGPLQILPTDRKSGAMAGSLRKRDLPDHFGEFWADRHRFPVGMKALTDAANARMVGENLEFLDRLEALEARVTERREISLNEAHEFYQFTSERVNVAASTARGMKALLPQLDGRDVMDLEQAKQFLACFRVTRHDVILSFGPDTYTPFRNSLPA